MAVGDGRSPQRLRDDWPTAFAKIRDRQAPVPDRPQNPDAEAMRRADVIFFVLKKKEATEAEPAWRIVETLQQSGARVALGWCDLPMTRQPLLDQWQRREISAQQLTDQLGVSSRAEWVRRALRPDLLQVALGAPGELLGKIRAGDALSEEERTLPAG